jgi:hypothetical protein
MAAPSGKRVGPAVIIQCALPDAGATDAQAD